MKNFLALLFLAFSFVQCKKDHPKALPPETITGQNTFGALVNGEVFLPGVLPGSIALQANYQHLEPALGDGFYLIIVGNYQDRTGIGKSIAVYSDSMEIQNGMTYPLKKRRDGQYSGDYVFYNSQTPFTLFATDDNSNTGQLTITPFDETNQVVSGRFWFDAVDDAGNKAEIREGRFDVHYTR
jgi:hypothetical protein